MSKPKKTGSPARILAKSLSHSKIPVYLTDPKGNIAFANPLMAEWAGIPVEQLLGVSCSTPLPPDAAPHHHLAALLAFPRTADSVSLRTIAKPNEPGKEQPQSTVVTISLSGLEHGWSIHFLVADGSIQNQTATGAPSKRVTEEAFQAIVNVRSQYATLDGLSAVIGQSPQAKRTLQQIKSAIGSESPICIRGPEGSGKGEVARAIFAARMKRLNPSGSATQLFPVDCRLMDASLLTNVFEMVDASGPRGSAGKHQGLLLEWLDQLPQDSHSILLQYLQQPKHPPMIATTSVDRLSECYSSNPAWRGLISTLDVVRIDIAGLVERADDIPILVELALQKLAKQSTKPKVVRVAPSSMAFLQAYSWPGNTRELFQAIEVAYNACESLIEPAHLPIAIRTFSSYVESQRDAGESLDLDRVMEGIEKSLILRAVELHPNNRAMAARYLGISRTRLLRRLEQLGLDSARNQAPETIETPVANVAIEPSSEKSSSTGSHEEAIEFIEIEESSEPRKPGKDK